MIFHKISFEKEIILFFFLTAFFPYITWLPIEFGSDLQPYAFIISIVLLCFSKKELPKGFLVLYFIALEATLIFSLSDVELNEIRSLSSYWALFIIPFATYTVLKKDIHNVKKIIQYMFILYFLIGLIQFLFDKSFLTFLAHDWRTTDDRGVTNLMVEPTYYAIFCLLGIFIAYEIQLEKRYIFFLIFQIIFFSKSSMIIMLFILFLFLRFIFLRFSIKEGLIIFLLFSFMSFLFVFYGYIFMNLRFMEIFILLTESPFDLILLDKSINERLVHLFFSIHGWYSNFFILPNGFSSFGHYLTENLPNYPEYFIVNDYGMKGARIMSGYGAALFELGIGGILLIGYIWYLQTALSYPLYLRVFFLLFMLTAVPLAIPLVGIYVGLMQYNNIYRKDR